MIRPLLVSVFVMLGLAPTADARLNDVICDDSLRLEKQLTGIHGVEKRGQGLRGPDALLQMWVHPKSGDWTLVQNYANGTSCILAMGEHWEADTFFRDPA